MTRRHPMDKPTDRRRPRRRVPALAALVLWLGHAPAPAQPPEGRLTVAAVDFPALRDWDDVIDREIRAGGLRRYDTRPNPYRQALRSERFAQHHEGVPVYGADLVRQTEGGVTTALLGTLFTGIGVDTTPGLSAADARAVFDGMAGPPFGLVDAPSLWVFPLGEGGYRLAWRGTLANLRDIFIDAGTGGTLFETSRIRGQTVGLGTGQLGDPRKMSTESMGGTFRTRDTLRPAEIGTFDLAYDEDRFLATLLALFNGAPRPLQDLATDADNVWDDGTVVDVHSGIGWSYDYLATQLGWNGIDGRDGAITAFVHPLTPERTMSGLHACLETAADPFMDCIQYVLLLAFIDNAAYIQPFPGDTASTGLLVFGEPSVLPRPLTGLDIVAHEIAHGVTHFTAGLGDTPPPNEPGAINEAFSDIIGTATEFYVEEPGDGPLRADYIIGEDAGLYVRSLRDPQELSDPLTRGPYPDHYDMLFRGEQDAGGVHINATILGHAYFLAVEGGTNRTSGMTVTGVGRERRLEIERSFFNAWVGLLPRFADHAVAAQALVQSAGDLYGTNAAPTRALTDALRAVGILP